MWLLACRSNITDCEASAESLVTVLRWDSTSTVGIPTVQVESYLKYGSSILRLTTTACTAAVIRSTSSELVPDYLVPYNACDQIPAQPPLHMVSTVCVGIFPVVHETLMNLASQTVTKDVRSGC